MLTPEGVGLGVAGPPELAEVVEEVEIAHTLVTEAEPLKFAGLHAIEASLPIYRPAPGWLFADGNVEETGCMSKRVVQRYDEDVDVRPARCRHGSRSGVDNYRRTRR